MKNLLPLILGMMVVTYLPRLLPFLFLSGRLLPAPVQRFLTYIPYTALSALVARGIMQAENGMELATVLGIAAAGACSWFKGGLLLSVFVSIAAAFLVLVIL